MLSTWTDETPSIFNLEEEKTRLFVLYPVVCYQRLLTVIMSTYGNNTMSKKKNKFASNGTVRIGSLEVTDFKALDQLTLHFPAPTMANDPDVFVLGSRNGLGKTSVLEACALILAAARIEKGLRKEMLRNVGRRYEERPVNLSDLFVRSGVEESTVAADLESGQERVRLCLRVSRNGWLTLEPDSISLLPLAQGDSAMQWEMEQQSDSLASFSPEPLAIPPLLYFHSNRRVSEGAPEFGAWVERGARRPVRWRRPGEKGVSAFKMELLSLLMNKADLFESSENGKEESAKSLEQLNQFIERYAGGRIDKLLPAADNTVDFRIAPSKGGPSFSFDGLSSGQKEVISTLFLVWRHTRKTPMIILIDEPELHLNPEWQRDFVQQIYSISPGSQLIIATHSEDIFGSVPEDRRILLGN